MNLIFLIFAQYCPNVIVIIFNTALALFLSFSCRSEEFVHCLFQMAAVVSWLSQMSLIVPNCKILCATGNVLSLRLCCLLTYFVFHFPPGVVISFIFCLKRCFTNWATAAASGGKAFISHRLHHKWATTFKTLSRNNIFIWTFKQKGFREKNTSNMKLIV